MKIEKTFIKDLLIIEPIVFGDDRGYFLESYSKSKFKDLGIDIEFVQDNQSLSRKEHYEVYIIKILLLHKLN